MNTDLKLRSTSLLVLSSIITLLSACTSPAPKQEIYRPGPAPVIIPPEGVTTAAPTSPRAQAPSASHAPWKYLSAADVPELQKLFVAPLKTVSDPASDFETRLVWDVENAVSAAALKNAALAEVDSLKDFEDVMGEGFAQNMPAVKAFVENGTTDAASVKTELKNIFLRVRPALQPSSTDKQDPDWSFPSGHSTRAGARARLLAAIAPEKELQLLKDATLMCFNRMMLGRHYPTDITGGFVLGQAAAQRILDAAKADPDSQAAKDLEAARKEWGSARK